MNENSFATNPWSVDDASAFLKFCCPECDFQIPDLQMFSDHAIQNHAKSSALFGVSEKDPFKVLIKKEHAEYENDDNFYNEGDNHYEEDFPIKEEENPSFVEEDNTIPETVAVPDDFEGKHLEKTKVKPKVKKKINSALDCDLCFMSFNSQESLRSHRDVHQDGEFKICMHCDFKNKNWYSIKSHIDSQHPDHAEKQHFCEVCGKGFIFKGTLQVHKKKSHSKEKDAPERVCHECGFSTKSSSSYFGHMQAKHQPHRHQKCPHCDFHSYKLGNIHIHIDGKHAERYDKNFDCDHCTRRFVYQTSLKAHLTKLQIRKQLVCKLCGIQIDKWKELQKHALEVHGENRNSNSNENPTPLALSMNNKNRDKAICDLCNKECECLETLKVHKLEHQDGKLKCCMYCDYKNRMWDNLKGHIDANHPEHGDQKHLCDICGKGFIYQSSCKRHKLHNHQKKTCHICGKECFNKDSLKDHLSCVHNYEMMTLVCKNCGFTTKSKACLKSHIAAKHREENHKKCPYCDYHTHAIHRIQIHIDGKHPEHDKKNFSCDHCSRRFIFENSLKNHMDTVRNGPKYLARKKMKKDDKLSFL